MYKLVDAPIGENPLQLALVVRQDERFFLEFTIAVPEEGHVWTKAGFPAGARRAIWQVRDSPRSETTIISIDTFASGTPAHTAIVLDNSLAPDFVIVTVDLGGEFTAGLNFAGDGISDKRKLSGFFREGMGAQWDLLVQIGTSDTIDNRWRIAEGPITLSEAIARYADRVDVDP